MIQQSFSLTKNVGESSSNILALANVFLFLQIPKEFQPNNINYFENYFINIKNLILSYAIVLAS